MKKEKRRKKNEERAKLDSCAYCNKPRLLSSLFFLFFLLLITCASPVKEIHIHDRHSYSYEVIKDFAARTRFGTSPPPALVLIDHQYDTWIEDTWIENLLREGVVSAVHWVKDTRQLEQIKLPGNCIVSFDLGILAQEKTTPSIDSSSIDSSSSDSSIDVSVDSSVDFLGSILEWINTQKPALVTIALSGAYQHSSAGMYSCLTTALKSLSYRADVYLESETAVRPENAGELYRWQNWYGPVVPNRLLDPNIRSDPWIWYALPANCVELFKKKKVVIKGENSENILAVWNDPAYRKLQFYDSGKLQEILQSARESIFRVWNGAPIPSLPPAGTNLGLAVRLIVLGKDRGCLAWYKKSGDMKLFAAYCAAEALRDSRYEPVSPDEVGNTLLELAILGDWEDVSDPRDFIPGYHNLLLADGVDVTILQASLVPQRNYTKEAFLENLCVKAGFDKNVWAENKNLQWQRSPCLWYAEPLLP